MDPADHHSLPTLARPVPGRVVVQLETSKLPGGTVVPAGTRVTPDDAAVEFRTAAEVVVPPVVLRRVDRLDDRLRLTLGSPLPWAAVQLRLPERIDTEPTPFGLRLFVGRADVYRAFTRSPVRADLVCGDVRHAIEDAVRPAGFDVADAVLPADPREPEGVRLVAEWAVCPEKFLFVDVVGLTPDLFANAVGEVHLNLWVDGDNVPPLRLGCVAAVNRRTMELPPVPLRMGGGEVRLNVDPLADPTDRREVVDVLRVRAVRGGRTVVTYAERLAPLPPPLAARPTAAGAWSLSRRDGQAWLLLSDPGPVQQGRTLLVTAACCRRALPDGLITFAAGVEAVTAVRPPVWPKGEGVDLGNRPTSPQQLRGLPTAAGRPRGSPRIMPDGPLNLIRRPGELVAAITATFGGRGPTAIGCELFAAEIELPAGTGHGVEVRLASDPGPATVGEVYLLARVLDCAIGTACPADRFTRVVATVGRETILVGPARSGKVAIGGGSEELMHCDTPVPRYAEEPESSPSDPGLRRTSDTGLAVSDTPLSGRAARSASAESIRPGSMGVSQGLQTSKKQRSRSSQQAATLAAHFAAVGWPLSATALAGVLRYVLRVPVRVVPLEPGKRPAADPLRLGRGGRTLGPRQHCWGVRVILGPLDRRAFERFWPGTRSTRRVRQLLVAALGPGCDAAVQPVQRADQIPPWRLGDGRLGRSLWAGRPPSLGFAEMIHHGDTEARREAEVGTTDSTDDTD